MKKKLPKLQVLMCIYFQLVTTHILQLIQLLTWISFGKY